MTATINASNSGSGGLISTGDASGSLALQTAGTTAVTIDTSQKVGIGTTSPDSGSVVTISGATPNSKLRLAGGTSQNGLTFAGAGGGNQFYLYSQSGGLVTYDDTASAERMRIDSSGNVGIGTTSPDGKLKVVASGANLIIGFSGTQNYFDASENIFRNFAGTERMRINSSGYVGIAKSPNSLAMLEVRANSGSIYQLFLEQNNTEHGWQFYADQADGHLKFYRRDGSGSTQRFLFQSNGAAYSTTGTWGTISDARLKENIVDATPKLDAVMQLKVRNYNLIGEDLKQIGFVAQELEQVFPNIAETERNYDGTVKEDGIKSVKTTVLIPILVKAIQELKAINDQQAEELSRQAATINALVARIEALENK
jgi:hypothetical protein